MDGWIGLDQDTRHEIVRARIAELRAEADRARMLQVAPRRSARSVIRKRLGSWLVATGTRLLRDGEEGVRRRASMATEG